MIQFHITVDDHIQYRYAVHSTVNQLSSLAAPYHDNQRYLGETTTTDAFFGFANRNGDIKPIIHNRRDNILIDSLVE